jgi:hypothetical protein
MDIGMIPCVRTQRLPLKNILPGSNLRTCPFRPTGGMDAPCWFAAARYHLCRSKDQLKNIPFSRKDLETG